MKPVKGLKGIYQTPWTFTQKIGDYWYENGNIAARDIIKAIKNKPKPNRKQRRASEESK